MSTATEDQVESTWAIEQVYKSIKPVYELLGRRRASPSVTAWPAPTDARRRWHSTSSCWRPRAANRWASCSPLLRFILGIMRHGREARPREYQSFPRRSWPIRRLTTRAQDERRDLARTSRNRQNRVRWLLGEGPEFGQTPVKFGVKEPEELAKQVGRFSIPAPKTTGIRFGENIQGYVYEPEGEGKRPAVIWLAPFQTSSGFIASYYRCATRSPPALVKAGFVTIAYDPIATGARQAARRGFHEQHRIGA